MILVNVAKLKSELSKFLAFAQKGQAVIVTSHGQQIAKLGPAISVTTPPTDWKAFFAKHSAIVPKNSGTPGSKIIHQIRDED